MVKDGKGIDSKKRLLIALIIISPAFILISAILTIQHLTSVDNLGKIITLSENKGIDDIRLKTLIEAIMETDRSNQIVFNMLLPLFGAWVIGVTIP